MRFITLVLAAAAAAFAQTASLRVYIVKACSAGTGQRVTGGCLDKKPFLTQADIQSAEVHRNSKSQATVFVTFRHDAAVRELNVTHQNIGNRVAILVNGRVVATPVIAAASRQLFIEAGFTEKEAESIAAGLNRAAAKH